MLDAFGRIRTETEEDAVRRSEMEHAATQAEETPQERNDNAARRANKASSVEESLARSGGIGVWGAAPATRSSADVWQQHRVMAAAAMMAPLAAAQASTLAVRKARALSKHWSEALSRCKSVDEMIDVNRSYGERAMSMSAGEMWRFVERASLIGRAAAAPKSIAERNSAQR